MKAFQQINFCSPGRTFLQEGRLERRHQAQGAGRKLKGRDEMRVHSLGAGGESLTFQFSIIIQCPSVHPPHRRPTNAAWANQKNANLELLCGNPVAGNGNDEPTHLQSLQNSSRACPQDSFGPGAVEDNGNRDFTVAWQWSFRGHLPFQANAVRVFTRMLESHLH